MYRRFIATIAAAAIALTAIGSTPAFAQQYQDRTAQTIAALLGLAVVGTLIHKNREDKKERRQTYQPAPVHNPPQAYTQRHQPPQAYTQRHQPPVWNQPQPRPLPDRVNSKLLPKQCFRSVDTRHGKVRMFGQRCLDKHYGFSNRLPRACHYTFRTHKGDRRGYEARCLRDHGYRLARG